MIRLKRDRSSRTVKAKYRDPARIDNGVDLIKGFLSGENKFYKDGFWKIAKDHLKIESHGKCAFCETPTTVVYFGDVEHFRPKQRQMYWWLAYCYDNYLFSCRICNGFKSDQFPILGNGLPPPVIPNNPTEAQLRTISQDMTPNPLDDAELARFDGACLNEQAVLPNPYQQDPWQLFKWEVIEPLEEVNITHRTNADRPFVEPTIGILRLNRDALRAQRYQTYVLLKMFKDIFESATGEIKTKAEDGLKVMMGADREYCGMARYFISEEWQLGIPLPEATE
ncbi:MAG: hypothetical protein AB2792_09215 [Candidatus Thiodiazotropha sp.]